MAKATKPVVHHLTHAMEKLAKIEHKLHHVKRKVKALTKARKLLPSTVKKVASKIVKAKKAKTVIVKAKKVNKV